MSDDLVIVVVSVALPASTVDELDDEEPLVDGGMDTFALVGPLGDGCICSCSSCCCSCSSSLALPLC